MSVSSSKIGRHNTARRLKGLCGWIGGVNYRMDIVFFRTIIAFSVLAGCMIPLRAGELEDLGRVAEKQANAGEHTEAVDTLRRAIDTVIAKGPLVLRRVQFITEPPRGFGIYQPRANNVFRPGESLIVYAEPVGVAWKAEGGVKRTLIVTDFDVRTRDGKILGGQKEFGKFEFNSRAPHHEIMTHLTITVNGVPPASYVLTATYRDLISGKSATLEIPFEIRQPTAI
jgi:hypothetical protein